MRNICFSHNCHHVVKLAKNRFQHSNNISPNLDIFMNALTKLNLQNLNNYPLYFNHIVTREKSYGIFPSPPLLILFSQGEDSLFGKNL